MKTHIPTFTNGTYSKPCPNIPEIMIGAINCTGHDKIGLPKCTHCVSYKEDNFYDAQILKEKIPIVSEVLCAFIENQLNLF
jgi:hypothetical protein